MIVPEREEGAMEKSYSFAELVDIIRNLRSENGCPWDREQTHEECEEVIQAIDNKDDENLCEELGDVLLQVLMHSQIAEEEGRFTIDDVINEIARKMIRRHPHVFGDGHADTSAEVLLNWEEIKKAEKAAKAAKHHEIP